MIFPENVEGPWLRRALAPFEVMLTNGACVMPCGRLLVPAIKLTASGKLRFSALQCIDAILSGLSLVHWWVRYNVLTARLFCLGCWMCLQVCNSLALPRTRLITELIYQCLTILSMLLEMTMSSGRKLRIQV
jgi:hypothetical protein